ncbi:metallothionein [Pseudomonas sp. MWU12-2037]|uniref:metallothionein n=1 Tax=Pseudomonas sp. MWU12-2037 TaxID=2928690 RepID=UPI00200FCD07
MDSRVSYRRRAPSPHCTCKVGEHAVVRHKHYCCQACADHHPNGEPCTASAKCYCADNPR